VRKTKCAFAGRTPPIYPHCSGRRWPRAGFIVVQCWLAHRPKRRCAISMPIIFFLGADGFDPDVGMIAHSFLESHVNRAMVRVSRTVVTVCDSTKFNRKRPGYDRACLSGSYRDYGYGNLSRRHGDPTERRHRGHHGVIRFS
jgi:hypothetical protein